MAVIKCKMCGGDLNFEEGATVCECEYCGSKQTLPAQDNEKKLSLFSRANRLLRLCDFDKAAGIYETIVAEFPEEAEAYWCLVLSKYGIEYVDDPATGKKVPTCHRSSFESVMDDTNFELVMEYADSIARKEYREEAKQMEELRRSIIEVSSTEQPYDIFISYKEKDDNGERTLDSVLAQDIYDALTDKGYRAFLSRISLEDRLGTEYEPYIFAALNSAKVMLVVGTDYDYFNAVWVKNEWSRYLKLMAQDKSRHLIPCYKNIDAYDMPKEFNKLTALDLGKVGATQDLLRGIDKLLGKGAAAPAPAAQPQPQTIVQQVVTGGTNIQAVLRRGYDALEDGAFEEAKTFFNDALNSNAQSAEAYLGLFMAEIEAVNQKAAQSKYVVGNYTENRYWKRAKQYASGALSEMLNNWDSLRTARLQREAEEAEEARKKQEKEQEEARKKQEEEQKKKTEEVRRLQAQLRSGNFELTAEEQAEQEKLTSAAKSSAEKVQAAEKAFASCAEKQEADRLEGLISSKKTQLAGLGFFKGKEKKELQAQIDTLEGTLTEAETKLSEKETEIDRMKKQAGDAEKQANKYIEQVMGRKRKEVRERLFHTLGLDFSGNIVKFGSYKQNGKQNAPEKIEWLVLDKTDSGVLLISKYALDCKQYNTENTNVTWESCSLRAWLNNDFYNTAFSAEEQAMIATRKVKADKNPKYNIDPGKDAHDKMFLLSINEANQYFTSDKARQCEPTEYAVANGANKNTNSGNCWWWLRSPGYYSDCAADVYTDGAVSTLGNYVSNSGAAVRPALWVQY